jgi:hypothetical protein
MLVLKKTASYTDIPSPEIVAAQGALVSVGSSYVTYIDKKGQVRCLLNEKKTKLLGKIMRACSDINDWFCICSFCLFFAFFFLSLIRYIQLNLK